MKTDDEIKDLRNDVNSLKMTIDTLRKKVEDDANNNEKTFEVEIKGVKDFLSEASSYQSKNFQSKQMTWHLVIHSYNYVNGKGWLEFYLHSDEDFKDKVVMLDFDLKVVLFIT